MLKRPSGDCLHCAWLQPWSSDPSKEPPLRALSGFLPAAVLGWLLQAGPFLLAAPRSQAKAPAGVGEELRIPEDPPIFQVCFALTEQRLNILFETCQRGVSGSFF